MKEILRTNWSLFLFASFTLGLAPFNPPHILQKIEWISTGHPMRLIDWFDVVMHGTPWVLLVASTVVLIMDKLNPKQAEKK